MSNESRRRDMEAAIERLRTGEDERGTAEQYGVRANDDIYVGVQGGSYNVNLSGLGSVIRAFGSGNRDNTSTGSFSLASRAADAVYDVFKESNPFVSGDPYDTRWGGQSAAQYAAEQMRTMRPEVARAFAHALADRYNRPALEQELINSAGIGATTAAPEAGVRPERTPAPPPELSGTFEYTATTTAPELVNGFLRSETVTEAGNTTPIPQAERLSRLFTELGEYINAGADDLTKVARRQEVLGALGNMVQDNALRPYYTHLVDEARRTNTLGPIETALGRPANPGDANAQPPVPAAAATGLMAAMGDQANELVRRMEEEEQRRRVREGREPRRTNGGEMNFFQAIMVFFANFIQDPEDRAQFLQSMGIRDTDASAQEAPNRGDGRGGEAVQDQATAQSPAAPPAAPVAEEARQPTAVSPAVAAVTMTETRFRELAAASGFTHSDTAPLDSLLRLYNQRTAAGREDDLSIVNGQVVAQNQAQVAGMITAARFDNAEGVTQNLLDDAKLAEILRGANLSSTVAYNPNTGYGPPPATPGGAVAQNGGVVLGGA